MLLASVPVYGCCRRRPFVRQRLNGCRVLFRRLPSSRNCNDDDAAARCHPARLSQLRPTRTSAIPASGDLQLAAGRRRPVLYFTRVPSHVYKSQDRRMRRRMWWRPLSSSARERPRIQCAVLSSCEWNRERTVSCCCSGRLLGNEGCQ